MKKSDSSPAACVSNHVDHTHFVCICEKKEREMEKNENWLKNL